VADKQVDVRLNLTTGGSAPQGLRETAAQARAAAGEVGRLGRAQEEAARQQQRAGGGGGFLQSGLLARVGLGRLGGAAAGAAGAGALAGGVGIAVASLHTLAAAMNTATPLINTMGDASLSAAQKQRRVLEELPLVGGFARSLHDFEDALSGLTEAVRRTRAEMAAFQGVAGPRAEERQRVAQVEDEQAAREARARIERQSAAGVGPVRLSREIGPAGERERAAQLARLPLEEAARRAGVEVRVAEEQARAAARRLERTRTQDVVVGADEGALGTERVPAAGLEARRREVAARALQARRRLEEPREAAGGGGGIDARRLLTALLPGRGFGELVPGLVAGQVGRQRDVSAEQRRANEALAAEQRVNLAIQRQQEQVQRDATRAAQAAADAERLRGEHARANLEFERQRLGLLTQQVERIQGQAQAYGSATLAERRSAVAIAERVGAAQQRDPRVNLVDITTPFEQGLLQRVGLGEAVTRAQEQVGRADPAFQAARRTLRIAEGPEGQNAGEVIDRLRGQQEQLNTKLQQTMSDIQARSSEGLTAAFNNSLTRYTDTVIQAIHAYTDAQIGRLRAEIQNANQSRAR
jgi:hypothetical protein